MQVIKLTHRYSFEARRLWALCSDCDALSEVVKRLVMFDGMPSGQIYAGQKIDVMVSIFGCLPKQPYHMEVITCDHEAMRFQSSEFGAGVKSWCHHLQVVPTKGGCEVRERVEIDAGLMTWVFAAWAQFLYKSRHKPRIRLLSEGRY